MCLYVTLSSLAIQVWRMGKVKTYVAVLINPTIMSVKVIVGCLSLTYPVVTLVLDI